LIKINLSPFFILVNVIVSLHLDKNAVTIKFVTAFYDSDTIYLS
jgi:hypothetical protein